MARAAAAFGEVLDSAGAAEDQKQAALTGLAACACSLQDAGFALRLYDIILQEEPGSKLARHNRAVLLAREGQCARALAEFEHLASLDPGLASAWQGQAVLLAEDGLLQRAERCIARHGGAGSGRARPAHGAGPASGGERGWAWVSIPRGQQVGHPPEPSPSGTPPSLDAHSPPLRTGRWSARRDRCRTCASEPACSWD